MYAHLLNFIYRIYIIAIIAIALTKTCPIRYHTLANDSTRGRRDLPFDRGALPKRYVEVSWTLSRRVGAIVHGGAHRAEASVGRPPACLLPKTRIACESPDFTVLALAFARVTLTESRTPRPGGARNYPSNIFHRLRRTFSVTRRCSLRPCDVCFHSSPESPGPRALSRTARASPPHPPLFRSRAW